MPRPYHILIAENTDAMRGLLARIVAKIYPAVTISAVADGAQALQIYRQRGADLVIANASMPLLNGLDLVRTLRAQHVTIPIVLLSSDGTMAPIAIQAGADRFMVKQPCMLQEFQQTLLAVLPA